MTQDFFFVFENDAAANAKNPLLQTFEFQKKEIVYES